MKLFSSLAALFLLLSGACLAQRCDSISATITGDWRLASTAPRDGTTIEMLETFGVAPWYGRFRWSRHILSITYSVENPNGSLERITLPKPVWVNVDEPGHSVTEDACLFWRPYKGAKKYVDPTNGAQKTTAYWCSAVGKGYDPKKDRCK